jgi:hypothetical protein
MFPADASYPGFKTKPDRTAPATSIVLAFLFTIAFRLVLHRESDLLIPNKYQFAAEPLQFPVMLVKHPDYCQFQGTHLPRSESARSYNGYG